MQLKKIFYYCLFYLMGTTHLFSQVLIPRTGFNVIPCGMNTALYDAGGASGNYMTNSNGYTVIRATGEAQITLTGNFNIEGYPYDFLKIYDGIGTFGNVIYDSGSNGAANINITGAPGQSITVQLITDGSVQYSGVNFNVSFSSGCAPVYPLPANDTMHINCGTNIIFTDNGGLNAAYTADNNSVVQFNNSPGTILNLFGTYTLEVGDSIFLFADQGANNYIEIQQLTGTGTLNFQSAIGQNIRFQFLSNSLAHAHGFDMTASFVGTCDCNPIINVDTSICLGESSALSLNPIATSYTITDIPYAPLTCASGLSVLTENNEVTSPIDLPFTFKYFGEDYNQLGISTNGNIQLGSGPYLETYVASGPIPMGNLKNMIALNYSYFTLSEPTSSITYDVIGTAPNRIFLVCFDDLKSYDQIGSATNLKGQILLYETTNVIEMHITKNNLPAFQNKQIQGLTHESGVAMAYPSRNYADWTTFNSAVRFDPTIHPTWSTSSLGLDVTDPSNPVFTPTATGVYTLNYEYDYAYCTGVTDAVSITVTDIAVEHTHEDVSCFGKNDGSAVIIVTEGVEPFTYDWSPNNDTNDTVNNLSPGTYSVIVSDLNNCSTTATFVIEEPSQLTDTIEHTHCGLYTWGSLTDLDSGTHEQIIESDEGCSVLVTLHLTVLENPIAVISSNEPGVLLSSAGHSYQWFDCETSTIIENATNQSFSPSVDGIYGVYITSEDSCTTTSDCFEYSTLGLKHNAQNDLKIYPNPTKSNVLIEFDGVKGNLVILDSQGRKVHTKAISSGEQIDMSTYSNGVYTFLIQTDLGTTTSRLIKQ